MNTIVLNAHPATKDSTGLTKTPMQMRRLSPYWSTRTPLPHSSELWLTALILGSSQGNTPLSHGSKPVSWWEKPSWGIKTTSHALLTTDPHFAASPIDDYL